MSRTLSITAGIGQGTILGPLIFIFYVNEVITNISELRVNIYADDYLIYSVGNNWERMIHKIPEGLTACMWIQVCIGRSGVYRGHYRPCAGMSKVGYLLVISHIWCS